MKWIVERNSVSLGRAAQISLWRSENWIPRTMVLWVLLQQLFFFSRTYMYVIMYAFPRVDMSWNYMTSHNMPDIFTHTQEITLNSLNYQRYQRALCFYSSRSIHGKVCLLCLVLLAVHWPIHSWFHWMWWRPGSKPTRSNTKVTTCSVGYKSSTERKVLEVACRAYSLAGSLLC